MSDFTNQRIDEAALAIAHRGIFVRLSPGPFKTSDRQLYVRTVSGRMLSILPDLDTPALFEVVDLDAMLGTRKGLLGDKLPLHSMVELVMREAAK